MINPKIKKILEKYISGTASDNEGDTLLEWLKSSENRLLFQDYIQTNYAIDYNFKEVDSEKIDNLLLDKMKQEKSIFYKYRLRGMLKYAALFLVFLGLSFAYFEDYFDEGPKHQKLKINNEAITLKLDNGDIKVFNEKESSQIKDKKGEVVGKQTNTKLVYNTKSESSSNELVYNTLSVPYGKQFEIKLSDGTTVFLNAGTTFKYPVKFLEGKDRLVFVEGEAFFDVEKDKKHPFLVSTNRVNIRVLGTKFNVSSYKNDRNISTVLVEGAVNLYNNDKKYNSRTELVLKPNHKATWNKLNNKARINEVDVKLHIAWMDGKIIFRHTRFNQIIKKLERHYNVDIVNKNKELGKKYFTGNFDVETINEVLESFNENYAIDYIIKNNQIIIN